MWTRSRMNAFFAPIGALVSSPISPILVLRLPNDCPVLPAIIPTDYTSPDVQAWSFSLIALMLILIGLAVGALGSGMTLRRFLKV